MKKILALLLIAVFFAGCSEDIMDDINRDRNNASHLEARFMLPTVILKTAVETYAHDIAWYASVFVEHNAGTWGQHFTADRRTNVNEASLMNNAWNRLYTVQMILKDIRTKTAPDGPEAANNVLLGIAQVLTATNLAMTTDMWNKAPWTEALQGSANYQPVYDEPQDIYADVFELLENGITNLSTPISAPLFTAMRPLDLLYGHITDQTAYRNAWIRLANSFKARYSMRLLNVDNEALAKVAAAIPNGFAAAADQALFTKYEAVATRYNPWAEFEAGRMHFSTSSTLYNLMNQRNDPRMSFYFSTVGGVIVPAPIGNADQTQGGIYSRSLFSAWTAANQRRPTPIMTFHELLFIEAEMLQRTGGDWQTVLQEAITANFTYHGITADPVAYFNSLNLASPLEEIMTQKYIAMYEFEAIEAYNDYRRTGIPTMHNPQNAIYGFVHRFPYPESEVSNNSANVPVVNAFHDRVWWAKQD